MRERESLRVRERESGSSSRQAFKVGSPRRPRVHPTNPQRTQGAPGTNQTARRRTHSLFPKEPREPMPNGYVRDARHPTGAPDRSADHARRPGLKNSRLRCAPPWFPTRWPSPRKWTRPCSSSAWQMFTTCTTCCTTCRPGSTHQEHLAQQVALHDAVYDKSSRTSPCSACSSRCTD